MVTVVLAFCVRNYPVAPRWRSPMWSARAEAEGLTLRLADNTTGYFGVSHKPGRTKPYQAEVWRGGKDVHLGNFATAEEAALCVASTPEGQAAAGRAAAVESQGTLPAVGWFHG